MEKHGESITLFTFLIFYAGKNITLIQKPGIFVEKKILKMCVVMTYHMNTKQMIKECVKKIWKGNGPLF